MRQGAHDRILDRALAPRTPRGFGHRLLVLTGIHSLMHRHVLSVLAFFLAMGPCVAQDRVELRNGDRLTGVLKSMADGKLVLTTKAMGDVTIDMSQVKDLVTEKPVVLETTGGEVFQRRIEGLRDGALALPEAPSVPLASLARINPPPAPKPKWKGSVNVGAAFLTGNTDRRSVSADAEVSRRSDTDRITAKAFWSYADEKSTPGLGFRLTERRVGGSLKYDYFLSRRAYLLAQASAMGDTRADISLRFTTGAGAGYQWLEGEDLKFSTEGGVTFFSESFRSATPTNEYVSARGAYGLEWQAHERVKFLQNFEIFPSLEKIDDVYLTLDSRVQVPVFEGMFTQLQWMLDYDNTPSPGLERVDHRFVLSVGWAF